MVVSIPSGPLVDPAISSAMWIPQSSSVQVCCGFLRSGWEGTHRRVEAASLEALMFRIPSNSGPCLREPMEEPNGDRAWCARVIADEQSEYASSGVLRESRVVTDTPKSSW